MKHMEILVGFKTEPALQNKVSIPVGFPCTEFPL